MFRPLHSLVTVVLDPKVDKTEGGLVIPETSEATFRTGVVRAVGSDVYTDLFDPEKVRLAVDDAVASRDLGVPPTPDYRYFIKPGDRVVIGVQKDKSGQIMNLGHLPVDDGAAVLVNYHDIWGVLKPD